MCCFSRHGNGTLAPVSVIKYNCHRRISVSDIIDAFGMEKKCIIALAEVGKKK